MDKIFINGLSAKAGGGKSILTNYCELLSHSETKARYYVLSPSLEEYKKYEKSNISFVNLPAFYSNKFAFSYTYSVLLPRLLKKLGITVVFNLADLPIKTSINQVFLFDWPYALYPESKVWKMMSLKDWIIRKVKLYFFNKYAPYISTIIAQTETAKMQLSKLYGFKQIEVVPNAVSLDNLTGGETKDFRLPEGIKLLYLTHYYPHKNIEIFLPLADIIRKRNLNYKLITTLSPKQHSSADIFLKEIEIRGLGDIIINVGAVKMMHVPSLYRQCEGLLMPTLLESFSGTYVEAMYHKIPIFTSNMDFAIAVCGEAASYFDPTNAYEIIDKLEYVYKSENNKEALVKAGSKILHLLPDWNEAFKMYNKIIDKYLINGN